jgi:hypothetical protein
MMNDGGMLIAQIGQSSEVRVSEDDVRVCVCVSLGEGGRNKHGTTM